MKVTIINHTPNALELLLRTKNTRLRNVDDDPAKWSPERKAEHLAYMRDTIKSSWEFLDFVFEIEGVSRAFTHQLVRTRQASYAQESQRTVDVRDSAVVSPDFMLLDGEWDVEEAVEMERLTTWWSQAALVAKDTYKRLVDNGVPVQDARGILPTNMATSIIAKFNLRTLSEMAKLRLCTRTQGEYQRVFRAMRAAIIQIYPWCAEFIEVHCVANGTCAFPRYGKTSCKFYDPRMDQDALKNEVKVKFWSTTELQIAVPVAKAGKTM